MSRQTDKKGFALKIALMAVRHYTTRPSRRREAARLLLSAAAHLYASETSPDEALAYVAATLAGEP